MDNYFLDRLSHSFEAFGERLKGYSSIMGDVLIKTPIQYWSKNEQSIMEKLAEPSFTPIMGKRFYYGEEQKPTIREQRTALAEEERIREMAKRGVTITKEERPEEEKSKEQIFLEALQAIGIPEPEARAKELAGMSGEEAFEKMSEYSPNVAKELRETVFRKGGFGGQLLSEMQDAADFGMSFFYTMLRDPGKFLAGDFGITGEEYREAVKNNKTTINLDAKATGADNAALKGFISATPIARDFIEFSGSGAVKIQNNLGLTAIEGLTGLASLMLQLISMNKAIGPKFEPINRGMENWLIGQTLNSPRITPLLRAGQSMVRSIAGGLEAGGSYAALTTLQTILNNSAEGKSFDTQDLKRISQSAQLGFAMGGISKYWAQQYRLPPIMVKGAEETEQSILVALMGLRDVYDAYGDIKPQDFWEAFAWELFEVPAENLLPLLLGMGGWGSIIGVQGQEYKMDEEATKLRMRFLKKRMPHASNIELYNVATKQMDAVAKEAEAKLKRPINLIEKMTLMKDIERSGIETRLPNYVKQGTPENRKLWEEIGNKDTLRRMYAILLEKNSLTKKEVKDYLLSYHYDRFSAVDDQDFVVNQVFHELITMKDVGLKFATAKQKGALTKYVEDVLKTMGKSAYGKIEKVEEDIIERNIILPKDTILKETTERTRFYDKKNEVERVILKWTEALYGTPYRLGQLYDWQITSMLDEISFYKNYSEKAAADRIKKYVEGSKNFDEYNENIFEMIRGLPIFMGTHHLWGEYMDVRQGYNKFINTKREINYDIRNIIKKRLGFRLSLDKPFRVITHALFNGLDTKQLSENLAKYNYRVDGLEPQIKDMLEEFRAYIGSQVGSKYISTGEGGAVKFTNDWKVPQGLRLAFGIKEELAIKDYFPYIITVAVEKDLAKISGMIRNPHDTISRLQAGEFDMDLDGWVKDSRFGWEGLETYLNRGLREVNLSKPLQRFVEAYTQKSAQENFPRTTEIILQDWVKSMRALPVKGDIQVANFVKGMAGQLNKVGFNVKLDTLEANRIVNTALSFVYAGGLGLKVSSAVKNAFQGPMNNPSGMPFWWWVAGLHKTMTDPVAREEAWNMGILKGIATPALSREVSDTSTRLLQNTLAMFIAVDHYWNRCPIYWGARLQFEHYLNKSLRSEKYPLVDAVKRIGAKQEKGIAERWIDLAKGGDGAYKDWKDTKNERAHQYYEKIIKTIADEYGFLQQANSNWEYGKLGRPAVFGSLKGKLFGQYLTWPTWYFGTYLRGLVRNDFMGFFEHLSKGIFLMWIMNKWLGMNVKPWLLHGAMPMRPYGPLPQAAFSALEMMKAMEYGHEEWTAEAKDNLKRALLVAIPGYYGVGDFVKLTRDLTREIPYAEERTGVFHYEKNRRKAWSDFLGVTNYHNERDKMLALIDQGEYEAANLIGERWGIARKSNGSYKILGIRGIDRVKRV